MNKIEFIAAIRHIGWVTYQIAAGQLYNEKINTDQRESLIDGVRFMVKNPDITPEENHDNWMQKKLAQGWMYGKVKDFEKKTHPDLVLYDQLPDIEKLKDVADSTSHRLAIDLWETLQDSSEENGEKKMDTITFQALIDAVHFDPKKSSVKIVLVGASHVPLDKLTTLSPKDETIQVTLESKQTKIEVFPLNPNVQEEGKDITVIDEEGASWLKKAAQELEDVEEDEAGEQGDGN